MLKIYIMKKFLLNSIVKGIITIGFPIGISVLVSFMTWRDFQWNAKNTTLFTFFIIVSLIYLGISIFYICNEKKDKEENVNLSRIRKMSEWQTERLADGTKNIGIQIEDLKKSGSFNLNLWGFETECQSFCKYLCDTLAEISNGGGDISVCCTRRQNKNTFLMYAGKSTIDALPQRFRQSVDYKVAKDYYYVKSFDVKDTIIFLETEEIKMKFTFRDNQSQCKYRQYISIPVYDSNRKIVTRIEIVSYNETTIAADNNSLKQLLKKYVSPVLEWIQFSYQVQEALLTETPGSSVNLGDKNEKKA